jgi:hypothetical protein
MDVLYEAATIVKSAEAALRDLMQRAVQAGEYKDLPTLARMGEQLSGMTVRIEGNETPSPPSAVASAPAVKKQPLVSEKPGKPKTKPAYPRFKREGDRLVKIGWSKSERSEYQHRAPRSVGHQLLLAIQGVIKNKPIFAVEDLLPLVDPAEKTEYPPHQVYLALAWLRAEGIVAAKGREGYSLLVSEEPEPLFTARWKALPTR